MRFFTSIRTEGATTQVMPHCIPTNPGEENLNTLEYFLSCEFCGSLLKLLLPVLQGPPPAEPIRFSLNVTDITIQGEQCRISDPLSPESDCVLMRGDLLKVLLLFEAQFKAHMRPGQN